jgi:hypothetical protein
MVGCGPTGASTSKSSSGGNRPTASATYVFLASFAPGPSPRNCRANPSASEGSFTSRHTPDVSMSSRCTTRGAAGGAAP